MPYDIDSDGYEGEEFEEEHQEERAEGPQEEDFETYDDYYRALARYEADKTITDRADPLGMEPQQEDFDSYEDYYRALARYQTARAVQDRTQENETITGAIEQGVARAIHAPAEQDAEVRRFADRHAEPEDAALIAKADALEAEYDENEARLQQGELDGNQSEIDAGLSHRARISAELAEMPRAVPSTERSISATGREWQQNILKWVDYTDEQKMAHYPDLREGIKWSNQSDAPFMTSVDPNTGDLYQVDCFAELPCSEQTRRLKSDERLAGVPEESLAFVAHKMGLLGGPMQARKIVSKKASAKKEEVAPEGEVHIVDGHGNEVVTDRAEERKPEPQGPKPQTHIASRL